MFFGQDVYLDVPKGSLGEQYYPAGTGPKNGLAVTAADI